MSLPMKKESGPKQEGSHGPEAGGFILGILLTAGIAGISSLFVKLPIISIMGVMITSILLGILLKSSVTIPDRAAPGITFSSKILLRAGIILMGLRLNLSQIVEAGFSVLIIDVVVVSFTLAFMLFLGKLFSVERTFAALLAAGTAICGAAAIVAVAPLIKAKKEYTALAVACIAILGTVGTLVYTFVYPVMSPDPISYGVFTGATLHELAHVIAGAAPAGAGSSDIAILVKLGRVALLIPAALILGSLFAEKTNEKKKWRDLPIPWFIFGFLGMCIINTLDILPQAVTAFFITTSIFLLSMAMAGLGMSINIKDFKKMQVSAILVAIFGYAALVIVGLLLVQII